VDSFPLGDSKSAEYLFRTSFWNENCYVRIHGSQGIQIDKKEKPVIVHEILPIEQAHKKYG
jgi:hypothetical protein